ncbi:hypothetical protein Patl1_31522 [Pistacia atlantica]|uniref:Uncharacterized protein n=1 Tax=Pistacia atlantica TaxID=434234 RepID=A0ACC1AR05_9ROSI|nr:hypothetical protein Patl1_31522 [Pistacia atlantica]
MLVTSSSVSNLSIMSLAKGFSLKKIGSLIRKISAGSQSKKPMVSEKTKMVQVPKGYLPIYVGEESTRYGVPVKYLSFSTFQELMIRHSQDHDELDTKIFGPIKLACTPEIFDQTLQLARSL